MKENELRIGNWVIYQDEVDKVRYELEFSIGHFMGIFEKNYGPPEPIPLTEEWLLKLGFEKDKEEKWEFSIPGMPYVWRKESPTADQPFTIWYRYDKEELCISCEGKYVHQLQNLYFALTGEEL